MEVIHENLATLGLAGRAEVFTSKAATVLERARADIVFLDPPYELSKEYEISMSALDQSETTLVFMQHSSRFTPQEEYGRLRRYRVIKQGDNCLSFYVYSIRHSAGPDSPRPSAATFRATRAMLFSGARGRPRR